MVRVDFIQFVRPYGEKKDVWIELDEEDIPVSAQPTFQQKVGELRAAGFEFSAECIENNVFFMIDTEELIAAAELVANGPPVVPAIIRLVENAYTRWKENDFIEKESK